MAVQQLRIGVIGAGANTRLRHIPGLQAIEGVEIAAVCNRTEGSGRRVTDEFGILRVETDPEALFTDPAIDAICIGTWPYRHREYAVRALAALLPELAALAHHWGMDVLVEVHDRPELERALRLEADLVGVNNRNLKTVAVDLATTEQLAPKVPRDRVLVAESGLGSSADLARMARVGASAFLIGESFMRKPDVEAAVREILAKKAA